MNNALPDPTHTATADQWEALIAYFADWMARQEPTGDPE